MFDVCFIAYGDINTASSRMRAWWVAEKMENATVRTAQEIKQGGAIPDARAYVWQKIVDLSLVKEMKKDGKLVFWDVCEPHWWWEPSKSKDVASSVNAVVCANKALADDYYYWKGEQANVIKDRFDLGHFGPLREHKPRRGLEPLKFIWYGYAQNRFSLMGGMAALDRLYGAGLNLELTVMDDHNNGDGFEGFAYPIYHINWRYDQEVAVISNHDLALLPPYPGIWGQVKSNNRQIMAALCGVPTVKGDDWEEIYTLSWNSTDRQKVADEWYKRAMDEYDVAKSADEWDGIIRNTEK